MRSSRALYIFLLVAFALSVTHCRKDQFPDDTLVITEPDYKTKNVIIVFVDGPRYTETWGHPSRQYIPKRNALLQQGVLCEKMYNNGTTSTNPGHTAVTTGFYQNIANDGSAYPERPSFFQHWLQAYKQPSTKAWIIATKDKLEVLADCTHPDWKGSFVPKTDCGIAGLGTGYREDAITFNRAQSIITAHHPQLILINFKEPDAAGHGGDFAAYLKGIVDTDNYIDLLWQQVQTDVFYKDKTTLIVTNDHGRHTNGHLDGFVSHGDGCDGCRHIEMFAIGPDFKKNFISSMMYDQIDIAATVAELIKVKMPFSNGKIIKDIFR